MISEANWLFFFFFGEGEESTYIDKTKTSKRLTFTLKLFLVVDQSYSGPMTMEQEDMGRLLLVPSLLKSSVKVHQK